jgi:hypothetical protein
MLFKGVFRKVDLCISQTLDPTATNFGQFVHRMHPRLPAKLESTPPINDEVIQGGVKIPSKKSILNFLEIWPFDLKIFPPYSM